MRSQGKGLVDRQIFVVWRKLTQGRREHNVLSKNALCSPCPRVRKKALCGFVGQDSETSEILAVCLSYSTTCAEISEVFPSQFRVEPKNRAARFVGQSDEKRQASAFARQRGKDTINTCPVRNVSLKGYT